MPVNIIVEDGSGVTNANAYVDVETMSTLLNLTDLSDEWTAMTSDLQKAAIIFASRFLDNRFRFYGVTFTETQALAWPRTKNFDNQGRMIAAGTVPTQLVQAVAFLVGQVVEDEDFTEPDVIDIEGALSNFGEQGLTEAFKATTRQDMTGTNNTLAGAAKPSSFTMLFDSRIPDLELMLRSIGELKTAEFVTSDRMTDPGPY